MNKRTTEYFAWLALLLALASCAGALYFAWMIQGDSADRAASIQNAEDRATKQADILRVRALAKDTADERTRLTGAVNTDLLSVADLIEATGKSAGVAVQLSQALPENAPPQVASLGIRPVGFVVQAGGKFSSLMHAVELFESLPVVSSVERLDIERSQGTDAGAPWRLSIYIRVYTSADTNAS